MNTKLQTLIDKFDNINAITTEERSFQNDMKQLLREQVILLRTNLDTNKDMSDIMSSIENIQTRIATSSI